MIDTTETEGIVAAEPTPVHIRRGGQDVHADPYPVRLIAHPLDAAATRQVATVIALPDTPLGLHAELRTAAGARWRVVYVEPVYERGRLEAVAVRVE